MPGAQQPPFGENQQIGEDGVILNSYMIVFFHFMEPSLTVIFGA